MLNLLIYSLIIILFVIFFYNSFKENEYFENIISEEQTNRDISNPYGGDISNSMDINNLDIDYHKFTGIQSEIQELNKNVLAETNENQNDGESLGQFFKNLLDGPQSKAILNEIVSSASRIQKGDPLITEKKSTKCKFLPSYSRHYVCPDKYPNYLGANFGAESGTGINCNGKKLKANRAKAYAIIKNNKISKIKIIHKGNGYAKSPSVKIYGDGVNAKAKAKINKKGELCGIKIINSGSGYERTPRIKIGKPNGNVYCHLCCRL